MLLTLITLYAINVYYIIANFPHKKRVGQLQNLFFKYH